MPRISSIFSVSPFFYLGLALVAITWFVLRKTSLGLRIRSVGENPSVAEVSGISVTKTRYLCVIVSGMFHLTPKGAALETDARLPGGDRLRGRYLFLARPDGRTQAYKISGVKTSGRSCLVFVDGGAGLEASPSGYRETYFPHKEFAGGPGTFLVPNSAWTTD